MILSFRFNFLAYGIPQQIDEVIKRWYDDLTRQILVGKEETASGVVVLFLDWRC
ncbi:hypothetical protein [Candidatus Liberibacter americanus]|uniref:hypothetical protein n=1 Tax=Candidatus Liberibacter americanus TaxID=309868 RepID=UPI000344A54F|nr:hypothetical protein [Candidatus Liberibacter americanus]